MVEVKRLSELYPQYYKSLPPGVDPSEVDSYVLNLMFPVDDHSGAILHARKKLLIPGVRSGGKSLLKDVKEARDTLNRYIDLMEAVEQTTQAPAEDTHWFPWFGGAALSPVVNGPLDIQFRNGTVRFNENPEGLRWEHHGNSLDIVKYRPSKK